MFRIWAPEGRHVCINQSNTRVELSAVGNGWFAGSTELDHGHNYSVDIDDQCLIPDPRSPWQSRWAAGRCASENTDLHRAKMSAAINFLSPYIPLILQGEEWGVKTPFYYFVDTGEPELTKAIADGRPHQIIEFGGRPQDAPESDLDLSYVNSTLNRKELSSTEHAEMLRWYKSLIEIRETDPYIAVGQPNFATSIVNLNTEWLCVRCGSISIFCNFSTSEIKLEVQSTREQILLASGLQCNIRDDRLQLSAQSVAIIGISENLAMRSGPWRHHTGEQETSGAPNWWDWFTEPVSSR